MGDVDEKNMRRLNEFLTKLPPSMKLQIDDLLKKFQEDFRITEFTFPQSLTNIERGYIHARCAQLGLRSASSGQGDHRRLTVSKKKEINQIVLKQMDLSEMSQELMLTVADDLGQTEQSTLIPGAAVDSNLTYSSYLTHSQRTGNDYTHRISCSPAPRIPKKKRSNRFDGARQKLPIWNHKKEILNLIDNYQVVFIKGDTGSGKTTQVPQFILDDAYEKKKPVRVLCTVPRRIAAVSISDRVATERGEKVGDSVGYQIRLECCFSPVSTVLTYCTSGILLRSLTSFDYSVLKNTTHIILDEVHERDRHTDLLLACIRDLGRFYPNLSLILMGADMDNQLLTSYFGGPERCPMLTVKGRLHPVKIMFLDGVLAELNYENLEMERAKNKSSGGKIKSKQNIQDGLVAILQGAGKSTSPEKARPRSGATFSYANDVPERDYGVVGKENTNMDRLIQEVWETGSETSFRRFLELVGHRRDLVDYKHTDFGCTMLMAAAVRGWIDPIKALLSLGADVTVSVFLPEYGRTFTAIDWADDHDQTSAREVLAEHQYSQVVSQSLSLANSSITSTADAQRLERYLATIDEDRVDLILILKLIRKIHISTDYIGAILVFLPGYDEIVNLKQLLFTGNEIGRYSNELVVFLLHSNIQTGDQKSAFEKPPRGVRKIVLSTNIAETSLTIEDIVYVIDSGKVKEKSYDSMTGVSQLRSNWISKASANQRQGRAGRCRPGVCYRLYSKARYEFMPMFPTPEILRSSLQELCLYARAFIIKEKKIEEFFARLPEPPAPIAVKKAIDQLIALGAISKQQELTQLGLCLLDLPVEPALGKALIYGVVLQCLDPILSIISIISYRDPFQMPADPSEKQRALGKKAEFAAGSLSDHFCSLRAFQYWEISKMFRIDTTQKFCSDQFLSSNTFEMVYGIRAQLLGHLRAARFVNSKGAVDLHAVNANSDNSALIRGILVATLYPNLCVINREKKCLYNEFHKNVSLHPLSTVVYKREGGLPKLPLDWIMYDEMSQHGPKHLIRGCTGVGDLAVAIFAGNQDTAIVPSSSAQAVNVEGALFTDAEKLSRIKINSWISLEAQKSTVDAVMILRNRLERIIISKLRSPSLKFSELELKVIRTIALSLEYEDAKLGLQMVEGIGQWPKLVAGNLMSAPRTGYIRDRDQKAILDLKEQDFVKEIESKDDPSCVDEGDVRVDDNGIKDSTGATGQDFYYLMLD